MSRHPSLAKSFDAVKTANDKGCNLREWKFVVNNDLNIVENNSQIISIVKTKCGGLFTCTTCGHKWTKKSHSTILFQCDKVLNKIECKLFGHICLMCPSNPAYHIANYNHDEIDETIEFLRIELLRRLHPRIFPKDRRGQANNHRRYGPPQRYYDVDFANYCESCRSGDYCRLHKRN